jgi:amino acid transporter
MIAAVNLLNGGEANTFAVVLDMAISTTLISYILIFPTLIALRYRHPDVDRPFRVPGGQTGVWVIGIVCTAWALLGSWVAVFPDTLEYLFGADYNFQASWGVSRLRFEVFTLGTLGVVILFAVVGYILGAPVRRAAVDVEIGHEHALAAPEPG